MASLVSALTADHAAAASGTAEFFSMGTAQLSSLVYSDANGVTAVTSTTLDAYGSAVRYVGEPVDVILKNAAGAQVMAFTHIDDARVVRLESSAFTGPNTSGNGQIVAGGRTTEAAAWDLFGASVGTADATVTLNGTTYTIVNAVGQTSRVFNVRSYGADNTGAQDAGTAVVAAIAACNTAGGGWVYFPAGTYRFASAITVADMPYVRFVGDGAGVTILKNYGATAFISFTNSGVMADTGSVVMDMTLTANAAVNAAALTFTDAKFAQAMRLAIDKHRTGIQFSSTSGAAMLARATDCRVSMAGVSASSSRAAYYVAANSQFCSIVRCYAKGGASSGDEYGFLLQGTYASALDCVADSMATGVAVGFAAQTANITIQNCRGTGNDTDLTRATSSNGLSLSGNQFATMQIWGNSSTPGDTSRWVKSTSVTSALVTFTVTPDFTTYSSAGSHHILVASSYAVGAATVTVAAATNVTNLSDGTVLEFSFQKTGANALNFTWDASYKAPDGATTFAGVTSIGTQTQCHIAFRKVSSNWYAINVGATVTV